MCVCGHGVRNSTEAKMGEGVEGVSSSRWDFSYWKVALDLKENCVLGCVMIDCVAKLCRSRSEARTTSNVSVLSTNCCLSTYVNTHLYYHFARLKLAPCTFHHRKQKTEHRIKLIRFRESFQRPVNQAHAHLHGSRIECFMTWIISISAE